MAWLRRKFELPISKKKYLSMVSGSEAGIATTSAIIAGLVTSTDNRSIVVISAFVALLVQGFNSALNYVETAYAATEIDGRVQKPSIIKPLIEAGIQFITHVAASLIVLIPIIWVRDLHYALIYSIIVALIMLFLIGFGIGKTVRSNHIKHAVQSMLLGALVISGGLIAGLVVNN